MTYNDAYHKAKEEGRLCSRCGWLVTKGQWKKGIRMCQNCEDALKGVNVPWGHKQPPQEPIDQTGES